MAHKNGRPALHRCQCLTCQDQPDSPTAEVHRAINRFLATADERSRRLLAGSLALQQYLNSAPLPFPPGTRRVAVEPDVQRRGSDGVHQGVRPGVRAPLRP
jgi:hypothetical protein